MDKLEIQAATVVRERTLRARARAAAERAAVQELLDAIPVLDDVPALATLVRSSAEAFDRHLDRRAARLRRDAGPLQIAHLDLHDQALDHARARLRDRLEHLTAFDADMQAIRGACGALRHLARALDDDALSVELERLADRLAHLVDHGLATLAADAGRAAVAMAGQLAHRRTQLGAHYPGDRRAQG